MKPATVNGASVEELVRAYRVAAAAHGAAVESGDYLSGNRHSDLIAAIYRELRERGASSQHALLPLLSDPDDGVRGWAGAHALEFAADVGAPVLVALEKSNGGLVGFSAQMTLQQWRKGQLSFP